jgi:hydrogenase maturation protease
MAAFDRTVVLGLGNPLRGDDGVGLLVAQKLAGLLSLCPIHGVSVRTAERAGFDIIDLLSGAHGAIVVDCLEVPDAVPGRVRVLATGEVRGSARLIGGHDIGLGAALELGRLLGLPMPQHVEIVGIEAGETTALRQGLTPAVAVAATRVAEWLHAGLRLDRLPHALRWLTERGAASPDLLPFPDADRCAAMIMERDEDPGP